MISIQTKLTRHSFRTKTFEKEEFEDTKGVIR